MEKISVGLICWMEAAKPDPAPIEKVEATSTSFSKEVSSCGELMPGWDMSKDSVKYFPGIQNTMGIESTPDFLENAHLNLTRKIREESFFGNADSMLSGNRATDLDGFLENLPEGALNPIHFRLVALIRQAGGVQVAITHVPKGSDFELVLLRQLQNARNLLRVVSEHHTSRQSLEGRGAMEVIGDEVLLLGEYFLSSNDGL